MAFIKKKKWIKNNLVDCFLLKLICRHEISKLFRGSKKLQSIFAFKWVLQPIYICHKQGQMLSLHYVLKMFDTLVWNGLKIIKRNLLRLEITFVELQDFFGVWNAWICSSSKKITFLGSLSLERNEIFCSMPVRILCSANEL